MTTNLTKKDLTHVLINLSEMSKDYEYGKEFIKDLDITKANVFVRLAKDVGVERERITQFINNNMTVKTFIDLFLIPTTLERWEQK